MNTVAEQIAYHHQQGAFWEQQGFAGLAQFHQELATYWRALQRRGK